MDNRKQEILTQLENGEITAAEAFTLLSQMDGKSKTVDQPYENRSNRPPPVNNSPPPSHHRHSHEPTSWVEDLIGSISGAVEEVVDEVKEWEIGASINEFMSGSFGHHRNTLYFTSDPISQGINKLVVIGKNAKVQVYGYDGNVIRLRCAYDARRPDAQVVFTQESGEYQLMYDEKLMRSMEIVCEVPHMIVNSLHAASKNAAVSLHNVQAGAVVLYTKNDKIIGQDISCNEFVAQTKNDSIKVGGIHAQNMHLETTNAKIVAQNVRAHNAEFKTTNDGIKMEQIDIGNLKIFTTSGTLKLEKFLLGVPAWDGERTMEAHTTNANINFATPHEVALKLEAHARDGKINCAKHDMHFTDSHRDYVKGMSHNYDYNTTKLNVRLSTTNGNVRIRE